MSIKGKRITNRHSIVSTTQAYTPEGSMMLDLLSFLILVFQINLLRRCGSGGGQFTMSETLISACDEELVSGSGSKLIDESL